ncbi:MAG TPA: T9SS type A sorting domain-containing protein [Vicingaceae bacterium]|nr:T9SS type A sorting domain-containing protein [Vicingaceae bacterium]
MKTMYISVLALFFSTNLSSQTVNQNELNEFYEKQQTPFLEGHTETFYLSGTSWERLYGEKEYVLTPLMQNIDEYFNRIQSLDEPMNGIYKSTFHFINVEITTSSKLLLETMNIYVPNYIQSNINVYLPQIDIDELTQNNINFTYLTNYGKQNATKFSTIKNKAILYSEGFESSNLPNSNYSVFVNSVNCGWDDVGCKAHTGQRSVWSAGNGTACFTDCTAYPNNMSTDVDRAININTNGYKDFVFKFWIWFDLGNNDEVYRYYNIGNGWVISSLSYNGTSSGNLSGWLQYSASYLGTIPYYKWSFRFISNSISSNEQGAYIDDLELSGTLTTSITELNLANSISIYPNPTNGIFSVEADNMKSIEITSITGEIVQELVINNNKTTIDLTSFSSGIYFAKIITDKGSAIKKIVLN